MGGDEPPSGIRARPGRPLVREVTGTVRSGAVTDDGPSVPAGSGGGSRREAVDARVACRARRPTRSRHPRRRGRSPCRRRSGRRRRRPAPAARAIARSAGESPTTATRGGSVCSAWHRAKTGSGAGFIGNPSSPQTIASTASRTPRARSVASVGARSSVVTTAIRRPPSRSAPKRAGRSASGHGQRDRVRARTRPPPSPVARRRRWGTSAAGRVATISSMPAIVAVASGPPAATRPVDGIEADRREHVRRDRAAGRPPPGASRARAPSRPTSRGSR